MDKERIKTEELENKASSVNSRDDTNTLYVSRNERGRGLASIENYMDATFQILEEYTKKIKEKLIVAATNRTINIKN